MITLDDPKLNEKLIRIKAYNQQYYQKNKEWLNDVSKQYNRLNKKKINEKRRAEYAADGEKQRLRAKNYLVKNREKRREYAKQYYVLNSEKVLEHNKQYHKNHRELRRSYEHNRKAVKFGIDSERFHDIEIFKRDNWVCGICGERVDRNLVHPHPYSKNLDHIIPISKGGSHTRMNTQCSHRVCNIKKYNKMPITQGVAS